MTTRASSTATAYPVYKAVKCVADHQPVIHTDGEYVNGEAHTNGLESFWSTLKHAYRSIYRHNIPRKILPSVFERDGRTA